ncbi:MAG: hypothetical protein WCD79_12710 [Chthoniobacteraceae bacterium]
MVRLDRACPALSGQMMAEGETGAFNNAQFQSLFEDFKEQAANF